MGAGPAGAGLAHNEGGARASCTSIFSLFSDLFPAIWARTSSLLRCPPILQFTLQLLRFAYEFSSSSSSCSWVDEVVRNYIRNYFKQKPIITRHCTRLQCVYVSSHCCIFTELINWQKLTQPRQQPTQFWRDLFLVANYVLNSGRGGFHVTVSVSVIIVNFNSWFMVSSSNGMRTTHTLGHFTDSAVKL